MNGKLLIFMLLIAACASAPQPTDPCDLLANDDILAIQGAAPLSAHATSHTSGDVTVSQCFYLLPEQSRSVTLEITTARNVRELWEKQFEPNEKQENEKEPTETHAIEVKGIGRDAFWGGNRVSGALFVLTRGAILRVSIGGGGDVAMKMEHAKILTRAALKAMRTED